MFTKEAQNFTSLKALFQSIVADLLSNGFTQKFPVTPITPTDLLCTLEAGSTVDPLAATQKWRIRLQVDGTDDKLSVVIASPTQLPDDGSYSVYDNGYSVAGYLGISGTTIIAGDSTTSPFFDRRCYDNVQKPSYPMSYKITITTHGVALYIWEPGNDLTGNNWSAFVVQRPVSNVDGVPRVTGKCPLQCLYAIKRYSRVLPEGTIQSYAVTDIYNRFVVREVDIDRPGLQAVATVDADDNYRSICIKDMVAITEDNSYVIMFPNNLNSSRYCYPIDELDMLGYTSADVVSQNTDASISMYGEAQPRVYRAMQASAAENTGMRFMMLHAAPSLV